MSCWLSEETATRISVFSRAQQERGGGWLPFCEHKHRATQQQPFRVQPAVLCWSSAEALGFTSEWRRSCSGSPQGFPYNLCRFSWLNMNLVHTSINQRIHLLLKAASLSNQAQSSQVAQVNQKTCSHAPSWSDHCECTCNGIPSLFFHLLLGFRAMLNDFKR